MCSQNYLAHRVLILTNCLCAPLGCCMVVDKGTGDRILRLCHFYTSLSLVYNSHRDEKVVNIKRLSFDGLKLNLSEYKSLSWHLQQHA